MHFRGSTGVKDDIMRILGKDSGEFPFRYLGVPLHSKKLNATNCRSLMDRITAKLHTWSAKCLTYAGRVELVRSVIGGMLNFWVHIFCFPMKVLRVVGFVCARFNWMGKDMGGLMFLVS